MLYNGSYPHYVTKSGIIAKNSYTPLDINKFTNALMISSQPSHSACTLSTGIVGVA